ncbi:virulence factor SrfC family protein [Mixta calida]|mgnify:CR=1 FL=1|uniref:virulence factor SrfC family protein n=1 Tax=Mixta calida TaxID=665913 RepID=UPI0016811CA8|nr:virulence factor SrfC family protein [Pantoea sp.]QNU41781.1 virulence factor [Mixta calida]
MKAVTLNQQASPFSQQVEEMNSGIDRALAWIDSQRTHSSRLDMEADGLKLSLRRGKYQLRQMQRAQPGESTIGFYGLSQAGKASLLQALVGDAQGRLTTQLAGKAIDYLTHINPGNQDYGMATRFSHVRDVEDAVRPLSLTLLSEAEMTRMVLMAFLQQPKGDSEAKILEARLEHLQRLRQPQPVSGLASDELVALWDFSRRQDSGRMALLNRHFWPQACELAPWLSVDDRAQLFSLLWNDDETLTALWRQLAHTLHALHHAPRVQAPLSLLVDESLLPAELLFSNAAATLNGAQERLVEVAPCVADRAVRPVALSLAELQLLTLEVLIPLSTPPRQALFDLVEAVDIPGYGAALDEDARYEQAQAASRHPLAARLMRARRALFLEFYGERQGLDRLLVCTAASERQDASLVGRMLTQWLKTMQRGDGDKLKAQKPVLIWAVTRFDGRYLQKVNIDEAVQRRTGVAGSDWGSMLAQDAGGIERMAVWLQAEVRQQDRLTRLKEGLQRLRLELGDRLLANWAQPMNDVQQKQQIADNLLKALQTRTGLHGELLERLQPSREQLRAIYLLPQQQQLAAAGAQHAPAAPNLPSSHFGIGFEFDLFSSQPAPTLASDAEEAAPDSDSLFAHNVQRYWIHHLRSLPDNDGLLSLLGVSKSTLQMLVEELITASFRLDVAGSLLRTLTEHEAANAPREGKVDRQVSRALTVLGDFVAWLGFLKRDAAERPDSRVNRGHKIFAQPQTPAVSFGASQRLTRLSAAPANTTAFYIYDWLVGLNTLIVENNGYAGGSDIDDDARQPLQQALKLIQSC